MSLEARVGAFVIASLLVLGATVYFVRTTQDVRGQLVYTTYLRYAGGVANGTPVLFAGIRVGQVASVQPSAGDPTRIEIAARVATLADSANDVMTILTQEVPALTGEARAVLANFRELSGTKNQKQVETLLAELNGMVGRESPKIADITERFKALSGHADELVVSVKPLVANLDDAVTNVSATVDAVREPLTRDLAELQRTLENAGALIESVRRVVGDNEDDIHHTLRSLRMASDNVRLLSETVKERPWNLIRTTQPPDRKVPR